MAKATFPDPGGVPKGNTANRPSSPEIGAVYSNTASGYIEVYTSAGWSQLGVIPVTGTIGTATDVGTNIAYGSGSASVTFTPSVAGGLASSHTVTSTSGGYSGTGATSPIVVSSIPTGTAATFTVTSTNGYGNSLATTASNSITTTSLPQAPTLASAANVTGVAYGTAPSASVVVTANATGGKAISGFTVTSNPGSYTGTGTSPVAVAGLTAGTSYTFTAVATNPNGNSTATSASSSILAATVPQAPTIGSATVNNATSTASVTYTANATGGAANTYTVTSSPGSLTGTGASPVTVSGLSAGTNYTFTVRAANAAGNSIASSASNSVSPVKATGGSVTYAGGYAYHTFTGNGTFTPNFALSCEYIVVGGGGGGGNSQYHGGGGAGAGGAVTGSGVISTAQAISIGGGGGVPGGSGGGSSFNGTSAGGGTGTTGGTYGGSSGNGYAGGNDGSGQGNGGGGGGSAGVGQGAQGQDPGGAGGGGPATSWNGFSYAGGGNGGNSNGRGPGGGNGSRGGGGGGTGQGGGSAGTGGVVTVRYSA